MNSFRNIIGVSKSLDLDQDPHSVGHDPGPNCLQRLSTVKSPLAKKGFINATGQIKVYSIRNDGTNDIV